ncbi:MAG: uracil-DNA glycosylase family protein [Bacteroidales bacterium]
MNTFADRVTEFNRALLFNRSLPEGIRIMNPFMESPAATEISSLFYRKYYNDNSKRRLILGINPGRHGAGLTGIPFTDTKRLEEVCGIDSRGLRSHEPSSVFVYDVINSYGGAERFYSDFFINSVCPLGFVRINNRGNEVNYNYYDSRELKEAVEPFIIESLRNICSMGIDTRVVWCLGTGKNYKYLSDLNKRIKLFDTIIPLEHPRFIMQYRSREADIFVSKYLDALKIH